MALGAMIYLDYAGSGLVRESVAAKYVEYCRRYSLNPHGGTRQAETCRRAVLAAERRLLTCLDIAEGDAHVIWTSGGTEALNLGIRGYVSEKPLAVVVDGRAHPAMTESARARCRERQDRLVMVRGGQWAAALQDRTKTLACVCQVNNETGQIADLGALRDLLGQPGVLMVDGAQSFGKIPLDWERGRVDLLSISSRKIGGPSAVGALVVRRGIGLAPLVFGGGQQGGIRSGTVDVIGAVMFADAAEEACQERVAQLAHLRTLGEQLWRGLAEAFGDRVLRLSPDSGYPGIASFSLPGYEGAVLKRLLAECHDIVIGTGSACSAESGQTSHVLADMGVDERIARGALRVSFSGQTCSADLQEFLTRLKQVVASY